MRSNGATTNCCGSGSWPGAGPNPTVAATPVSGVAGVLAPTNTPVPPTNTPEPPTSTPTTPMAAALDADYSALVLYATKVGQPPQGLDGTVSGGDGGAYTVMLYVRNPDGSETSYNLLTPGTFAFDAMDAGDDDFGTTVQGSWTAWIEASDTSGNSATSPAAVWDVSWYPVNERP